MKHTIQKLSVLTLMLTVLFTTALPVHAELSQTDKDSLKQILASNPNDILSIMMYLYTLMYSGSTPAVGTTNATNASTQTSVQNARMCDYANRLTLDLRSGMTHSQVKSLQGFLNTLAYNNRSYQPVATSGDGSFGRETEYFGSATQSALTRWQSANMTSGSYTTGILDSATRAKMRASYCGTKVTNTTTGTQATPQAPGGGIQITNDNTSTLPTYIPSGASSYNKPELSFNKTSVSKGGRVEYTINTFNYNVDDSCRMHKNYINQGQETNNTVFSKSSGTYVDYPELTTEYFIRCNYVGNVLESDHITVVVDGVSAGASAGTGNQTISFSQDSNNEYASYLMSGGAYRYFFTISANVAAGSVVNMYYGASSDSCTSLPNKVTTTGSLSSVLTGTIAASDLQSGRTYYFCAAAVTSSGAVVAETPVQSFVAK